ncbi:MAG: pyruvate dehydrogenase complex dihydrolipoamide acetyltransferase [Alphaproteobacteria bacterium]|nr:MAG: pyruvate dehydrogenase complex dihydrolipoamide acetyltransferase [Alphaproteobacteria bacterium]
MSIPILMPALSPTMEEGTLAKWLVKEGDSISPGDVIAEIETDKATMEVEAVDEGTMGPILVAEGTEGVAVNTPIGTILSEGEEASAPVSAAAPAPSPAATPAPQPAAPTAPTPQAPAAAPVAAPVSSQGARILASPLARRMAEQQGLDLKSIAGSGPHGRIVKRDVEGMAAPAAAPSAPAATQTSSQEIAPARPQAIAQVMPQGDYDEIPLDNMRKIVAKRLTESKQTVPHFYLSIDCEIDKVLALRRELNAKSPEGDKGFKISVNDFIIRASALALKRVPEANSSWTDTAILRHHHADIAVAVAIEGGLITPIVRQAENKGLSTIANEMKDLATRARDRKLKPEEFQGGTFSISNLGMFGIKEFSAVINPPHGAILAIGAGEERPVVKDGALAVATMMTVTLSCDHRVVDGAIGAQFLAAFKGFIEDPLTMML